MKDKEVLMINSIDGFELTTLPDLIEKLGNRKQGISQR
jgi:hypothetical protein